VLYTHEQEAVSCAPPAPSKDAPYSMNPNPENPCPEPAIYSPAIKRHLVTALYFESKRQGRPMTALTNEILERALHESQPQRPTEQGADGMVSSTTAARSD